MGCSESTAMPIKWVLLHAGIRIIIGRHKFDCSPSPGRYRRSTDNTAFAGDSLALRSSFEPTNGGWRPEKDFASASIIAHILNTVVGFLHGTNNHATPPSSTHSVSAVQSAQHSSALDAFLLGPMSKPLTRIPTRHAHKFYTDAHAR